MTIFAAQKIPKRKCILRRSIGNWLTSTRSCLTRAAQIAARCGMRQYRSRKGFRGQPQRRPGGEVSRVPVRKRHQGAEDRLGDSQVRQCRSLFYAARSMPAVFRALGRLPRAFLPPRAGSFGPA